MTLGYPRCPKCGKAMAYVEEIGKVRWSCDACRTEQVMGIIEFIELRRECNRAQMNLRTKFPEFYR